MEHNQGNNRKPRKPEGDRPKNGFLTPLMIALVLVLAFSWISNMIQKSQYKESTIADFWAVRKPDSWRKWRSAMTGSST